MSQRLAATNDTVGHLTKELLGNILIFLKIGEIKSASYDFYRHQGQSWNFDRRVQRFVNIFNKEVVSATPNRSPFNSEYERSVQHRKDAQFVWRFAADRAQKKRIVFRHGSETSRDPLLRLHQNTRS